MHTESVTTPFGRRPVTLALVRRQQAVCEIPISKSVDKWKVFRDASVAMELLGLQSSSLSVLDALLTFFPEKNYGGMRSWWFSRRTFSCRCERTACLDRPYAAIWVRWSTPA